MKPWTKARNNNRYMKSHPKLTYQLSFLIVSRKVDYHAGGKWNHNGDPVHRKTVFYIETGPMIVAKYMAAGQRASL